jgi:hypothetical protein
MRTQGLAKARGDYTAKWLLLGERQFPETPFFVRDAGNALRTAVFRDNVDDPPWESRIAVC